MGTAARDIVTIVQRAIAQSEVDMSGDPVFVFGSNLAGRHGKGAALWARQHRGAIYGRGEGPQGNSYAIPTKDGNLQTLPLDIIANHVVYFLEYALSHPELTFQVTPIGCGLAGYEPKDIAPMFNQPCPRNVVLPVEFTTFILQHEIQRSGVSMDGTNETFLPCPFCGAPVEALASEFGWTQYTHGKPPDNPRWKCPAISWRVNSPLKGHDKVYFNDAIAAWNRRTPPK